MEDNYPKYYSEEFREEFLEVDDSHVLIFIKFIKNYL